MNDIMLPLMKNIYLLILTTA